MAASKGSGQVTRADVAREAGVSTAVVSYVVNNGPRPVAGETAERVRAAMTALHYQPNLNARALKRGRSQTLGLVVVDSLNPFFTELSLALEQAAAERGHRMLVAESHGDPDIEDQLVRELTGRQVDGLLLVSSFRRHDHGAPFSSDSTPTVFLDSPGPLPGRHTIGPDAAAGARTAVQHLIGVHGRASVGLVIGPGRVATPDPRETGWRRALAEVGIPAGRLVVDDWSNAGGYRAVRRLINDDDQPDGLFISSDVQAVGALRALHEAGVDIARECPIVSFDGTRAGSYTWPALTSARQPVTEMARTALELIERPQLAVGHHSFAVELLVRDSCGCPVHPPVEASAVAQPSTSTPDERPENVI